jgi:hypothetical protein
MSGICDAFNENVLRCELVLTGSGNTDVVVSSSVVFRRVRKIATNNFVMSVCPHGINRLPRDGF